MKLHAMNRFTFCGTGGVSKPLAFVAAGVMVASAAIAQAPKPLLSLQASQYANGGRTWIDGQDGYTFDAIGSPSLTSLRGVSGVSFNGRTDAFVGPMPPEALVGSHPRTIEIWALNPSIDSDEETMISWGRRGGPTGSLMAFGWGANPGYGAMAHWSDDLGWNGVPSADRWHLLAYTYDGHTAKVYDDGLLKATLSTTINTADNAAITIAAQTAQDGKIQFKNEYTGAQQAGSLVIASIKIYGVALDGKQILGDFTTEAKHYGAKASDAEGYLADGVRTVKAGGFKLTLLNATGGAVALMPLGSDFNFVPGDRVSSRSGPGFYYLGDCTFRLKSGGGSWQNFTTAHNAANAHKLPPGNAISAYDLTNTVAGNCPIRVVRRWMVQNGQLLLRYTLYNPHRYPVTLGAFGAAMVFNNDLSGKSLNQAHDTCSFADPCIGEDGGYLQVTRLNGHGPALLVLPDHKTPFEAYRPLYDDPTPRGVTFEGFYEWMCCTQAYLHQDWRGVQPWNPATERVLRPDESTNFTFRFATSPGVQQIQQTLMANKRPVAVGIPGYVVPTNQPAELFLHANHKIAAIDCIPHSAMSIKPYRHKIATGWVGYALAAKVHGRCLVSVRYTNGTVQNIQYFVTPPETVQVSRYGSFMASHQWFDDPTDPFHRTDSFLGYDRATRSMVLQRYNSWFVGLSDEVGAGPSVGMAMKNANRLNVHEVHLLDQYVSHCLWGHVQNKNYSVRASLFYYEPKLLPTYHYTVDQGWDKARSETTWRTFNYPHVASVYWAMYRIARTHPGLKLIHSWSWYLLHAYRTAMAIKQFAPGYAQFGLMVGSIFPKIIHDMQTEGWTARADKMRDYMHSRERYWITRKYPFGSEMPWDSTGQEEIYTWCRYLGANNKARVTIDAVLGYMPLVANWAYNGAARRYWDGAVNGCHYRQIVRMTNHYGSGINSIPVLDDFRRHPSNLYLLRVGYAGMDQLMANIYPSGFASYGFVADPAVLNFDPYSADYGIAFYGYARNDGSYLVHSSRFGWLGFGCAVTHTGTNVVVSPRDGFHRRAFLAPLGLWIRLKVGEFKSIQYNTKTGVVNVVIAARSALIRSALLSARVTSVANRGHSWYATAKYKRVRGLWSVPLKDGKAVVTLVSAG